MSDTRVSACVELLGGKMKPFNIMGKEIPAVCIKDPRAILKTPESTDSPKSREDVVGWMFEWIFKTFDLGTFDTYNRILQPGLHQKSREYGFLIFVTDVMSQVVKGWNREAWGEIAFALALDADVRAGRPTCIQLNKYQKEYVGDIYQQYYMRNK